MRMKEQGDTSGGKNRKKKKMITNNKTPQGR